jgi:small GTP-binding protein
LDYEQKIASQELNEPIRGAIIGRSGVGKSSLINAIFGKKIAKVGVVECTTEAKEYEFEKGEGKFNITDLPGCSTVKFPIDTYISNFELLKKYDFCIVVFDQRIFEDDAELVKTLKSNGKSVFVVRNRYDDALRTGAENNLAPDEVALEIKEYFAKQIGPSLDVHLVSTLHPHLYDLDRLISNISSSLPGMKEKLLRLAEIAWSIDAIKAALLEEKS